MFVKRKEEAKPYAFTFYLSYTTHKSIEVKTEKVRVELNEYSEERAKRKLKKIILKKVEVNIDNIIKDVTFTSE